MSIPYVQIALLLLALFLLVQMTQKSTTDKLSAAGAVVKSGTSSIHDILVHPLDSLMGNTSNMGVWDSTSVKTVPAGGSPISNGMANGSLLGSAKEGLSVQPVDYDAIFKPKDIQPADLIPKIDPDLFPGVTPDFNQSFMNNELQAGLPTSSRRKYIHDLRPIYPNPITATTPFGNPTTFPDVNRRSLCDL